MKIYLATRWGNPESPDGPDGEDTNLLVRASSVEEAAAVTDAFLARAPTTSPHSRRPVQAFCHHIVELGVDSSTSAKPDITHGPWVAHAFSRWADSPAWTRNEYGKEHGDTWIGDREYYGEINRDA